MSGFFHPRNSNNSIARTEFSLFAISSGKLTCYLERNILVSKLTRFLVAPGGRNSNHMCFFSYSSFNAMYIFFLRPFYLQVTFFLTRSWLSMLIFPTLIFAVFPIHFRVNFCVCSCDFTFRKQPSLCTKVLMTTVLTIYIEISFFAAEV